MMRSLLLVASLLLVEGLRKSRNKNTAANEGTVFTLGDSYSSGVGVHDSFGDYDQEAGCQLLPEFKFCCRSLNLTAGARYARVVGMEYVNLACGGHATNRMERTFKNQLLRNPEFSGHVARQFENDVIHFTIGGNNIRTNSDDGWEGTISRCLYQWTCHKNTENYIKNFDEIEELLVSLFSLIASRASKARIRAMGYPHLAGWKSRWWPCLSFPGLRRDDATFLDTLVDDLNAVIQRGVERTRARYPGVDFKFVDVSGYLTEGACMRTKQDVYGIDVIQWPPVSPRYLHPTPQGYERYAVALADSLG